MKHRYATPLSFSTQEQVARSPRRRRRLLTLALAAFPVWMALVPAATFAAQVGSSASNANVFMPANGTWTTLRQIAVPASNARRYCIAVGSADTSVQTDNADTSLFTLVLDEPQPPMNLGQERTVEFGPDEEGVVKEVTTTQGFMLAADAAHTIYWLGRPEPGSSTTVVEDRSLSVVCDSATLGIVNSNPEPLIED